MAAIFKSHATSVVAEHHVNNNTCAIFDTS